MSKETSAFHLPLFLIAALPLALTPMLITPMECVARDCMTSCGTFTFQPPYVDRYQGTGPHWSVRCIYLQPAAGLHNVRTFLYRNGVYAQDNILVTVGDQGLEVGADWKDEMLDGVRERWWNTDLYAYDGHFYHISVKNQPSDVVHDIHTRHVDLGSCGTFGHYLWYVIFDYVSGPVPTETPTNTPQPTITPGGPTLTPSPTPNNVVYSFNFETFFDFQGPSSMWRLPNALPANPFASWPVGDGSYENLAFSESNNGLTGKAARVATINAPVIRGGGIELFFVNATALTPGTQYTAYVSAKSDQLVAGTPNTEYSDIVLAWEPGSSTVNGVQDYNDVRTRLINEGPGWKQLSMNFTSSPSGDRILIAFAGNSPSQASNYGCLFDNFLIVQASGIASTATPTPTSNIPTNTPAPPTNTPPPGANTATPTATPTATDPSIILEDYEDGFTSGINNGWTAWEDTWGGPDQYAQGTGRIGSGSSQGIRVYYGSGGAYRQNVPVVTGRSYQIKAYIRTLKGDQTAPAIGDNSVVWAEFGYDLQNRTTTELGSNPAISYWEIGPKDNANLSSGQWKQHTTPAFTASGPFISIWVKAGSTSPLGLYLLADDWELIDLSAPTGTPTTAPSTATPTASPTGGGPSPTATATCSSQISWVVVETGTSNPITNGNWPQTTDDGSGGLNTITANISGQTRTGDNRYMNLTTTGTQKTKIRKDPAFLNGTGSTVRVIMRVNSGGNAGNFGFELRDSFGIMEVGYEKNAGNNDGVVKLVNGDGSSTVSMPVPNITAWHTYWMVHSTNGNVYFWLDPDANDNSLGTADLMKADGNGSPTDNRVTWGNESSSQNVNQDFDDVRFALGAHLPSEDCDIVGFPTATPTTYVSPTPTPTNTLTPTRTNTPIGKQAWKLEYSRQYGQYMTGGVAGQAENFASWEDGRDADIGITNQSNPNVAIFGYTGDTTNDPYTPGNVRTDFNLANRVYDFRVYNPPVESDRSPDCYWLDGLPHHGHYRWEFWWRKIADDAKYEFFPNQPVYHFDLVNGYNTAPPLPLQEAPNYASDDYELTTWPSNPPEHWQTFVVPQNINRITGAKAFAVRLPANKFRMTFSIHQGGVNGPQVGPSVTSREIQSDEYANVHVTWGLEDVPVTPGGSYAMKVTYPGGFNMYGAKADNYKQGQLYNGTTAVPGYDMVGIIVGARRLLPDAPTSTPVAATPTSTMTPIPTATSAVPTNTPVVIDRYDYFTLFGFSKRWQDNQNETSYFETAYDFVPDGVIDTSDLFEIYEQWHQGTAAPTPTTQPTATPTTPPPATATPTSSPTPSGGSTVYSYGFETFFDFQGPGVTVWRMPNALPDNLFGSFPISDGSFDSVTFLESNAGRTGKAARIALLSPPVIRGGGFEIYFIGATALVPGKKHTVTVWAKSDQLAAGEPNAEYSDIALAWEPGDGSIGSIQQYDAVRTTLTNQGPDWKQLSITFTSSSVGDRILLAFSGNSPTQFEYGCLFDDMVITQDEP